METVTTSPRCACRKRDRRVDSVALLGVRMDDASCDAGFLSALHEEDLEAHNALLDTRQSAEEGTTAPLNDDLGYTEGSTSLIARRLQRAPDLDPPTMQLDDKRFSLGSSAGSEREESGLHTPGLPLSLPPFRRPLGLTVATPSSTTTSIGTRRFTMSPRTPEPDRGEFRFIPGDIEVAVILFDFDGTLTASPGQNAKRSNKQDELQQRAPMLAPRLRQLREHGIMLGIISKSSELTISGALHGSGLHEHFNVPLVSNASSLEGKAGLIDGLLKGSLRHLGPESQRRVMLIDDDVFELDRARERGIHTYAAPKEGGLQEEDFDTLFACLGLRPRASEVPSDTSPQNLFSPLSARSSPLRSSLSGDHASAWSRSHSIPETHAGLAAPECQGSIDLR